MTTLLRRLVSVLMLAAGLLGSAACAAATYAVWRVEVRLQQANDRAFDLIDRGLGAVEDRVRRVRERVEQSRITTGELSAKLRDWATRKAEERLVAKLEVERRAGQLEGQLRAADLWLESSEGSIRDAQGFLDLGRSLGADVDPGWLNEPLETLAAIRAKVREAEREAEEIREFASPEIEVDENRLARVLRLTARVVVTVTEISPRLDRFANRVSDVRADARGVQEQTSRRILWGAIGCTVVVVWVAAGQLALCVWGRRLLRRRPDPAPAAK